MRSPFFHLMLEYAEFVLTSVIEISFASEAIIVLRFSYYSVISQLAESTGVEAVTFYRRLPHPFPILL